MQYTIWGMLLLLVVILAVTYYMKSTEGYINVSIPAMSAPDVPVPDVSVSLSVIPSAKPSIKPSMAPMIFAASTQASPSILPTSDLAYATTAGASPLNIPSAPLLASASRKSNMPHSLLSDIQQVIHNEFQANPVQNKMAADDSDDSY